MSTVFANPLTRFRTPPFLPPTGDDGSAMPLPAVLTGAPTGQPDPSVLSAPTPPPTTSIPAPSSYNLPPAPTYDRTAEQRYEDIQNQRAEVASEKPSIWRRLLAGGLTGLGTAAAMTGGDRGQPSDFLMRQAAETGHNVLYGPQTRKLASLDQQEKAAQTGVTDAETQYRNALTGWDYNARAQELAEQHANQLQEFKEREADRVAQQQLSSREFDEREKDRAAAEKDRQQGILDREDYDKNLLKDREQAEKDRLEEARQREADRKSARDTLTPAQIVAGKRSAADKMQSDLLTAEKDVRQKYGVNTVIRNVNGVPTTIDNAWPPAATAELNQRKQSIQDEYEGKLADLGQSFSHYAYPQQPAAPTATPAATPNGNTNTVPTTPVPMTFPDGKRKMVPPNMYQQMVAAGGKPDAPSR